MYFDSHAHYDDSRFDDDRDQALLSLAENGVSNIINIGADLESSKATVALADKYDFVYGAVGVHPHDAKTLDENVLSEIGRLSEHSKVVAIGEIGLDYYYDNSPRDIQRYWFERQMNLAYDLNLPVIIHSRDTTEDTIKICKENKIHGGVIHCFSGSVETAKIFLDLGYYISFAGPVTFKNAKALPDVAKIVPEDRLLIETDSPYMAPEPHRGKRNCSVYVRHVCEKIAELRGVSAEHMAKVTADNAKRLFNIQRG